MENAGEMHILIVEDEKDTAAVLKLLLKTKLHASSEIAPDCASARQSLASNSYDLITMDYQLPDGDGLSLFEEIVGKENAPPVVMVTGHGNEQTAVSAFKLGASGYVVKDARMSTMLVEEARSALARAGQAEEELRESEERFRTIVENAPFGYYRVGKDGLWQYVNPVWERMHEISLEEVIGKPFEITQPENAVEQARELVSLALAGEAIAGEFSRLTRKGDVKYHRFNIQPVKHGNEIVAIEGFIDDITERKQAEEALQRANIELEGYAHSVSHDLKGPLSSIAAAANLLSSMLEGMGDDEGEALGIIRNSVKRALDLTESLLDLARAGQAPLKHEPVDISRVVRSILKEKELLLEERGTRVSLEGDLGVTAMDPTHAYQVFSNLIGNAIKHNDSENLEIHISRQGKAGPGAARYLGRDSGPGIPEGAEEDIFLPFHKGPNSTDTGIGLSIVDKVVRLYGGQIRAYNDGGACFEFALPLDFPQEP